MKLREIVEKILLEAADPRAQFAMGYRQGQIHYYDKNLIRDFTGYSDNFQKGYKQGIKDARMGKFNEMITKILTGLGDFLGSWNIGGRSDKY